MNAPKQITITLPILGLAVGTRALLGAGVALLLADKLDRTQRRSVGWTLAAVGALTTVPIALQVFGTACSSSESAV